MNYDLIAKKILDEEFSDEEIKKLIKLQEERKCQKDKDKDK
jgi:hypothetical protein